MNNLFRTIIFSLQTCKPTYELLARAPMAKYISTITLLLQKGESVLSILQNTFSYLPVGSGHSDSNWETSWPKQDA